MSITAIALDRFRLIMNPSRQDIRVKTVYYIIVLLWLLAFILSTPLGFFTTLNFSDKRWICTEITLNYSMRTTKLVYSILGMVLLYGTPVVLVSIAYAQICILVHRRVQLKERHTRSPCYTKYNVSGLPTCNQMEGSDISNRYSIAADRPEHGDGQGQPITRLSDAGPIYTFLMQPKTCIVEKEEKKYLLGHNQHRRTSLLLASVSIFFACSWLPINIVNLLMDLKELRFQVMSANKINEYFNASSVRHGQKEDLSLSKDSVLILQAVCLLCVLVSACINPMLYGWLNENFRRRFKQLLRCTHRVVDETEVSTNRKRGSYALWPRSSSRKNQTKCPAIIISGSTYQPGTRELRMNLNSSAPPSVDGLQRKPNDTKVNSASQNVLWTSPVLLETDIDAPPPSVPVNPQP